MASEQYREILETKRLEIVKGINLERTILFDYLRTNLVFDQQDCELIRAATTNDGRVGKLIDSLLTKGPKGYQCFLDVVQFENPTLFESLTGEKASSKPNEQMRPYFNYKPGLEPSVDYQQRILQDLTDSVKRYRDALKVNEELQKKLEDANNNLEFEKARNKHLENRLTQEMEIDNSLEKNELLLFHEYDEMERGIADRDVYIIVLQMKLLTEKEEVEKLRKAMEELEHKNEKMARELKRVSMSYNQERCQSLKLSECIRIQGDEIQKVDELRKQLRECQYKNIIATEERDAKIQELLELTKWTEALKTRFDALEKEKQNSLEKTEVVSSNCVFLQETVRTLSQKLSSTCLELEETKKRYELMAKDCELYKTQRNCALEARREAVNSRDKVISEKDAIQAQYNDLLSKREQMNEERAHIIQSYDALHARYERTSEELTLIKTALNEKEMEVEDLIRKLKEANDKNHRNSVLLEKNLPSFSDCSDDDDDDDDTSGAAEQPSDTAGADEETANRRRPWRERRMKSLLNSIKSRISGDRGDEAVPREHMITGSVTLDMLHNLLPNLSTRPCNTMEPAHTPKLSRTLQRQMCLRKQKVDCALQKSRSKTAPCGLENTPDIFTFDTNSQGSVKSASSTPNLVYPDDVNDLPPFFRERSCNVIKKQFRRAQSAD